MAAILRRYPCRDSIFQKDWIRVCFVMKKFIFGIVKHDERVLPYTSKSCAKADKKALYVSRYVFLPVACCHISLVFMTLSLSFFLCLPYKDSFLYSQGKNLRIFIYLSSKT